MRTFETGDQLLGSLEISTPDVIISDIRMPGIDGLALLNNRKRHHKRGFYGLFSLVSWLKENS